MNEATSSAGSPVDISRLVNLDIKPEVQGFHDQATATISYIVRDPSSKACAIIDSVMDFDPASGRISFDHADVLIQQVRDQGLALEWIIETHAHADHLSAAPYIQEKLGGRIGIGENILTVQEVFGKVFNEGTEFERDGSQFDALFSDRQTYRIGNLTGFAMHTPGHTPACMTHVIGNAAFVGDTLFMPDGGTARADFPGGDAGTPEEMRLFMCHDYGPGGREVAWETTVAEEKAGNIHVGHGTSRDDFIRMRTERDKTLNVPKLILPSLQVNIRAGHIPQDPDGRPMLKIPVNQL